MRGEPSAFGVGERFWSNGGADHHLGFFDFDVRVGDFVKRGDAFPFPRDERVGFKTYAMALNTCAETAIPTDACFGVGLNMLSLDANENARWYGSPTARALLMHVFPQGIYADASIQLTPMREVVDGRRSAFNVVTFGAAVGWIFSGQSAQKI